MNTKRHGRQITDLDWAMQYVWDRITSIVATDRKTAHIGVVALGSDRTQNELDDEASYRNIAVVQELDQIQMPELRNLSKELKPSNVQGADAMSALIIAIQLISTHCKQLKYVKRIILVTNGEHPMDTDDLDALVVKLKEDGIELAVLGPDFDDADYNFKEEDKSKTKTANEAAFRQLTEATGSVFGTLAQAVEELGIPRIKSVRPVHSYRGTLALGDANKYDTAMNIDIERFPRTMVARPPTASNFVVTSNMAPGESTQQAAGADDLRAGLNGDLAAVRNARVYQVPDDKAPGGKRDVDQDDLAKGYVYGSTAVYIAESDRNVTTFETTPGMQIIGFVAQEQYQRYMDMSRTNVIIAQRTNDKAILALSSFINALYELGSLAIARFVAKDNKPPVLLLLAPSIEPDLECLYDVELPYHEDFRSYRFPPLDRINTMSGKVLKQHRNLPSDDLLSAMSDYVDAMDLSNLSTDEEGKPAEYGTVDETFSPVLHRINQVIRHKAVYPNSPLPPVSDTLTRFSRPPAELVTAAGPQMTRLKNAADIKKVPPKVRSRRGRRGLGGADAHKPLSGLDVDALLSNGSSAGPSRDTTNISKDNAIPEFKQAMGRATSMETMYDLSEQLGSIVKDLVRSSFGENGYNRALEAMRILREEAVDLEEPGLYNKFVKEFKAELEAGRLGGERAQMWYLVRTHKLGLITLKESQGGEVSEESAVVFLRPSKGF